ncbi:MAG: aminodeoxychorismate synthase component I [Lachnospiraceae bacterium]|nr:aminodeoxychorismate synthase component I [Lachnospiraceae bacterium]
MAVFLDSSLRNHLGRYSIVGLYPYLTLVKGEKFTVNGQEWGQSFETYVKEYLESHREENLTELPIVSGAIGYFSYDYGLQKEGIESRHEKEELIPECILCFYDVFLVEDHQTGKLHLIANGKKTDSRQMMEKLLYQIEKMQGKMSGEASERLREETPKEASGIVQAGELEKASEIVREEALKKASGALQEEELKKASGVVQEEERERASGVVQTGAPEETALENSDKIQVEANFGKEDYLKAVDDVVSHIIEGDIYIMNLTQQLAISSKKQPYQVFQTLRQNNPSPFGGYFQYGDFQIISASPERFLQMKRGHVVTRPIKGTRKRGETEAEDKAFRRELLESEKDKSELLMIVDLERNDLNRVCVPGSVQVTELFGVETYATVFHLVSTVEGELERGKTVMDLMEATFPGGSITGAPKPRAMEIIDELEHGRRGLYTGTMGYLTLDGDCDFNIVIRTAIHRDGTYFLGVGGGITCESEREFEYEETLQKAKALLEAM